jgi:hypothetical protein
VESERRPKSEIKIQELSRLKIEPRRTLIKRRVRIRIEVKSWIWIRIKVKSWIQIRIEVMRIRKPRITQSGYNTLLEHCQYEEIS